MSEQSESYMNGWRAGYHNATLAERERIINLSENRICFDHQNACDHAACYALFDLIELIKGEQND